MGTWALNKLAWQIVWHSLRFGWPIHRALEIVGCFWALVGFYLGYRAARWLVKPMDPQDGAK